MLQAKKQKDKMVFFDDEMEDLGKGIRKNIICENCKFSITIATPPVKKGNFNSLKIDCPTPDCEFTFNFELEIE
jgi:hypothetical protein